LQRRLVEAERQLAEVRSPRPPRPARRNNGTKPAR
jgi:hypothetical protein